MKTKMLLISCLIMLLSSCNKEEAESLTIKKEVFTGYAQKGPFINGSSIMLSELDRNLNQTGRTYSTSIADNTGRFEQKNIELTSNFVAVRADGFYFNEVTGDKSSAQLTLHAIADVTDVSSVNVNIMTHLERSRIEYLVSQKQYTFRDAKAQAQKEVLNIFSFEKNDMKESETLTLASAGDDNAILLAASVIIQGYRTTADMSELLADIITDVRADGELTNSVLGSKLIDDARLLNLAQIRQNIENRYKSTGLTVTIPAFEQYVRHFIENTRFIPTKTIEYPAVTANGANILNNQLTKVMLPKDKEPGTTYSMAAHLPAGTNLKIVLKGNVWFYRAMPNGPVNWTITPFNNGTQTFTVTESGKNSDLGIQFSIPGTITIEFYENNAATPTKVKQLVVE